MVLKIFLLIVFLIAISIFVFFVLNILMPTVKRLTTKHSDPLFAPLELNYITRTVDNNIKGSDNRAVVLSAPQNDDSKKRETRLNYNGIKNCALFEKTYGSLTESTDDCIGFGDCAAVCPQEAIMIVNGVAQVTKNCCGCGLCVDVCPKKMIALLPKAQKTVQYKNDPNNTHIIEISDKKGFKFWQDWYKILS